MIRKKSNQFLDFVAFFEKHDITELIIEFGLIPESLMTDEMYNLLENSFYQKLSSDACDQIHRDEAFAFMVAFGKHKRSKSKVDNFLLKLFDE